MIPLDTLLLFIATTFVVVLSPGPAAIAVATEGASGGLRRSFFVIFGIAIANLIFFVMSATGIAALISASSLMFSIIKWVAVAYLLYLGIGAIFSSSGPLSISSNKKNRRSLRASFLKGFILEISNPKALLYFSALLPQFIDISAPIVPQLALMASITLCIDLLCYGMYGYLGWKTTDMGAKPYLVNIINKTAGGFLIFAGLKMATMER